MEKRYYTVYKTTNLINGKYYHGCHETTDLDDNYLGSGVALLNAIKLYKRPNFRREILHIFDNPEDMLNKERELVNHKDPMSYNLRRGGSFTPSELRAINNGYVVTEATRELLRQTSTGRVIPRTPEHTEKLAATLRGRPQSEAHKKANSDAQKLRPPPSDATCKKISDWNLNREPDTPETSRLKSIAQKNKPPVSKDTGRLISEALTGGKRNEKTKENMSVMAKQVWYIRKAMNHYADYRLAYELYYAV